MIHELAARRQRTAKPGRQAGFTLVELVTVILILGVLAAVALPRYADLQGKARAGKVNGALASVKAASAMVKAYAMANGVNCSSATTTAGATPGVTMEGVGIGLNYCYAQATTTPFTDGIYAAANLVAADWTIDSTNKGGSAGNSIIQIALTDATNQAACYISYTSAAAANGVPTITAVTTGC